MTKHANNGRCEKCIEIMERYPNFNKQLRSWFTLFQAKHKEAHISCAGRGHDEQEAAKKNGTSRAHYGESAHNYNCAIDIFENQGASDIYEKDWFNKILAPEIPFFLNWYGAPGSPYLEEPHIEVRAWRELRAQGLAKLVEPMPKKDEVA